MMASKPAVHRRAATHDLALYHVLHPSDPELDEWTQDYIRARAFYEQFKRDYGSAHMHVEVHHAGQYKAECLMRAEAG
jgi:hypothetical protein